MEARYISLQPIVR